MSFFAFFIPVCVVVRPRPVVSVASSLSFIGIVFFWRVSPFLKILFIRAGEMAQWLKVLAALPEDSHKILSPHGGSQSSLTAVPQNPAPASGLHGYYTYGT